MPRDENNRNLNVAVSQLQLQIEPAQAGHSHVEHEARRRVDAFRQQEILRRRKCLDAQAHGSNQALKPFADHAVVIDDEYDWLLLLHSRGSSPLGSVNWKIAPPDPFDSAHKRPPCASMIDRLIESPMPVPVVRVVKNGSNNRAFTSSLKPAPESCTDTRTVTLVSEVELGPISHSRRRLDSV